MTVILGLDTNSHTTGYSVFRKDKLVKWGTISVPKKYSMPRRLYHFYHQLNMLLDETEPDIVVVEDLQHMRNKNSVNTLAAFLGVARLVTYKNLAIDAVLIPPTEIKMAATNNGRAEKIEMVKAANKQFKLKLTDKDDDIADAIYASFAFIKRNSDG